MKNNWPPDLSWCQVFPGYRAWLPETSGEKTDADVSDCDAERAIIIEGVRPGQTFESVQRSAETGDLIICPDLETALRYAETAEGWGYDIKAPVTPEEFEAGQYVRDGETFYLKNKRPEAVKKEIARQPPQPPAPPPPKSLKFEINEQGQFNF